MDNSKFDYLETLSDLEFQALLDEYDASKINTLSEAYQIEVKEKLKKEAFRRMNLLSYNDADKEELTKENAESLNSAEDKITVLKRSVETGKKVIFTTAPQKICDIGKGLLKKIKNNVKKVNEITLEFSKNIKETIEDNHEKDEASLAAIDDALESLMLGFEEQKYVPQKNIERISKKGTIVSKLQPGVVRILKMPTEFISKISNRQEYISDKTAMGM